MWQKSSLNDSTTRCGRGWIAALLFLIVVAGCLDLVISSRQSLWVDEVFSLAMSCGNSLEQKGGDPSKGDYVPLSYPERAQFFQDFLRPDHGSVQTITRATFLSDTNPPLYYLLLNLWIRLFGASDFHLRFLSIVFALICVPILWSLGRSAAGLSAGMIATFLLLFSPTAVYYSTEARMYSLLWFETAALMWFSFRLLQRPRLTDSIGWITISCAGFWTHYFFLFVWVPAAILLLYSAKRKQRSHLLITVFSASLSLPFVFHFAHRQLQNWRITQDWLSGFPGAQAVLLAPAKRIWFYFVPVGDWGGPAWWKIPTALAFLILMIAVVQQLRTRKFPLNDSNRRVLLWSAVLAFCVTVAPSVVDWMLNKRISTVPRYALAGLPPSILFVSVLLSSVHKKLRNICVALFLSSSILGIFGLLHLTARHEQPFRQLGQQISNWAKGDDVLIVDSIPSGVLATARYSKPDLMMAGWTPIVQQGSPPENAARLTYGAGRIALLQIHSFDEFNLEQWLINHAQLINQVEATGHRLILLETRTSSSK